MDYRAAAQGKRYYRHTQVDIDQILDEVMPIIDGLSSHQQIMLQSIKGSKDYLYGTGRIANYAEPEKDFNVPFWNSLTYTNQILEDLGLYRARLMIMRKMVYSWHADPSPRVHIPLISNNETNFMVVEDEVIRMKPDGGVFWVDTTLYHTYVNTCDDLRVHIVGCVE